MTHPRKFSPFGNDLFGDQIVPQENSVLKQKFLFSPFRVLNSREGAWQERKAAWLSLGIQSEVGRGGNLLRMSDTILEPDPVKRAANKAAMQKAMPGGGSAANLAAQERGEKTGYMKFGKKADAKCFNIGDWVKGKMAEGDFADAQTGFNVNDKGGGTSIFDPVLCELAYDWFCPKRGQIIDPFCGGSVRGIVAACMGFKYWGGDLRQEQVDANIAQGAKICPKNQPRWICGDSNETIPSAPLADFIWSCPPYGDLEVYSDDPADLSNMDYDQFIDVYRLIIAKSCARLKPNRFADFVVGDIRDKHGHYRNFHGATIQAFKDAGLHLYNHAILINAVGTLALRVTRQFQAGRKLGKSHQDLLVFVKGDSKKAANEINAPTQLLTPPPRRQ